MPASTPPRRHFLAATLAPAAALCAIGTAGCQSSTPLRDLRFATLSEAQHELDRLASLADRTQTAVWTWPATLTHCAQSIRFALSGYPQAKSELFQRTVGRAAYQVFAWRGQMKSRPQRTYPGRAGIAHSSRPANRSGRATRGHRGLPSPHRRPATPLRLWSAEQGRVRTRARHALGQPPRRLRHQPGSLICA